MDTKVTLQQRNVNPYAENSPILFQLPLSFTIPAHLTHDGYPNLDVLEIDQVPVRSLEWFLTRQGKSVFVASKDAENGILLIETDEQAAKLHESQNYGYKFISLNERSRPYDGQQYGHYNDEPKAGAYYTYTRYLNGDLAEQLKVQYLGLTDNLKWYIFAFTDDPDDDGNPHHLLPVGEFPCYKKQLSPGAIHFEQYTSLLTAVK